MRRFLISSLASRFFRLGQPSRSGFSVFSATLLLLVQSAIASAGTGGGTVSFLNHVISGGALVVDAPIFDVDGVSKLSGTAFTAQLYAGPAADALAPVTPPANFYTGVGAGYIQGGSRTINNVAPGAIAAIQVKVWESAKGGTFEQAQAAGGKTGQSQILLTATGGTGEPPTLPSNLIGLTSFKLEVKSHTNTPPSISDLSDQTVVVSQPIEVAFSVSDLETAPANLTVQANSSNTTLFPAGSIVVSGSGVTRTLRITPDAGQSGAAAVTVMVSDGQLTASKAFNVTVNPPVTARGSVSFANFAGSSKSRTLDAPIFDTDGTTKLSGTAYLVQLYAGSALTNMTVVGASTGFLMGTAAGYFFGGDRQILSVAAGETAYVQIRVWEAAKGATFDIAKAAGSKTGQSSIFALQTGGAGSPPSLPTILAGLQSFHLLTKEAAHAPGDLDGDGFTDILLEDASGYLGVWSMDGPTVKAARYLTPSNSGAKDRRAVGLSDFNNDGQNDVLFEDQDGTLTAWMMKGAARQESATFKPSNPGDRHWRAVGTGDFNKDGKPDILFQHDDGTLAVWYLDGVKAVSAALLDPEDPGDRGWRVAAVGDIDGDGVAEIIFQHDDGSVGAWFMDGIKAKKAALMQPDNPGDRQWRVVACADVNRDGKADLLFQHEGQGSLAVWLLDGTKAIGASMLNPENPGGTWKIKAP